MDPRASAEVDGAIGITDDGPVRTFTLDRPKALNALTTALLDALLAAFDAAAADASVRAIVLTGRGRGFCAGQDLADPAIAPNLEPGATQPDIGRLVEERYKPLALRVVSMPVPVVAAVNGVAAGAGANLALCCDIVVAARSASFIQAFSRIGLVPDCGGTWLLPRLVGRAQALRLALLGDKLPAEEAVRLGLIAEAVEDTELQPRAAALAARLAALPSRALAETRRAMDAAQHLTFDAALSAEAGLQGVLGRADDYIEGVSAFGAKRAAVFTDR